MSYADPVVVTVSTVAKSLYRVGTSLTSGKYATSDRIYGLTITHNEGRRNRSQAVLVNSKIVVDPLVSDRNIPVSCSTGLYIDYPTSGYSSADLEAQLIAMADWLKAGTNAAKLVGRET